MTKTYRTVPADAVFATFSTERQDKIKARAAELIAEEFGLPDVRRVKPCSGGLANNIRRKAVKRV